MYTKHLDIRKVILNSRCHYFYKYYLLLTGVVIFNILINSNLYAAAGGDWSAFFEPSGLVTELTAAPRTTTVTFSEIKLRRKNILAVRAASGQQLNIGIRHFKIGSYMDSADWELRSKDMTVLNSGTLSFNQDDIITYTHNKDEVIFLCVDPGLNGFYLKSSNTPIGFMSDTKFHFFENYGKEMYFKVPDKTESFSLSLYSDSPSEHVKVKIYNSDNSLIAEDETSASETTKTITVSAGNYAGNVWRLVIDNPSTGNLEDYYLQINRNVAPVFTPSSQDEFDFCPFGTNEKLSVIVDKVMAGSTSFQHASWMLDNASNAGFNVYVARMFYGDSNAYVTDMTQLQQLAQWCDTRDMKTLVWTRGTLAADINDSSYDGKRYLPNNQEIALFSPNSDELWTHLNYWISQYATQSLNNPAIRGVFMDFEHYSGPITPTSYAYYISYDDVITNKYEIDRNITIPVSRTQRKTWLIANNYHDDFTEFQIAHWKERCKNLRSAIDAINPQFQFFIYPYGQQHSNNAPFIYGDAPIAELATPEAPVVHADFNCYWPPFSVIHDADAIALGIEDFLNFSHDEAAIHNRPYMLLAGFDPICIDNFEYLSRSPITGAEHANGFWVFYEGPSYPSEEHTECMDYFTWANSKIAQEDYAAADTSYETNRSWAELWEPNGVVPAVSGTLSNSSNNFSSCYTRNTVSVMLSCQENQTANISVEFSQLGSYTDSLGWELRRADDIETTILRGTLFVGQSSQTISFTPAKTETYILVLSSLLNKVKIVSANVPVAYYAAGYIQFFQNTTPLYLNVSQGVTSFNITAKAVGNEHVKLSIYSPSGMLVTEDHTSSTTTEKTINVNVGSYGYGAWKVVTGTTGSDAFEDFQLKIGTEIPQFLSLSPDAFFFRKTIIEAETGTLTSPMVIGEDQDASGGEYVHSLIADGINTIQFNIPEGGTYYAWGRVWESDGYHDSLFVYAEGDDTTSTSGEYIWDLYEGDESTWKWLPLNSRTSQPRQFSWTSGINTLIFRQREALARLDKIILTKDASFIPNPE